MGIMQRFLPIEVRYIRFEIFTAVRIMIFFWALVGVDSGINPEDWDSILLWRVAFYRWVCAAPKPKIGLSSPAWKPQITLSRNHLTLYLRNSIYPINLLHLEFCLSIWIYKPVIETTVYTSVFWCYFRYVVNTFSTEQQDCCVGLIISRCG